MDKNTIIGLSIIGLVIIIFSIVSSPSQEDIEAAKRRNDSILAVNMKQEQEVQKAKELDKIKKDSIAQLPDSVKKNQLASQYGIFTNATEGVNKFTYIENELIKVKIATLGGRVHSVELKKYLRYDGKPLILFDGDKNEFGLNFFSQNQNIYTNNLYFTPSVTDSILNAEKSEKSLSMKLQGDSAGYMEFIYTLEPNSYFLKYKINFVNMDKIISQNASYISLNWKTLIPGLEKGKQWEKDNSSIYWKFTDEEVNYLSEMAEDASENLRTKVKWISFKQQFFSTILVADSVFLNAMVHAVKTDTSNQFLKKFTAEISLPFENKSSETLPMKFYFGPNQYKILESFNLHFEKLVPLGWGIFGWVNKYLVIPIFNFLGSYISSYGIIILILTIIIKLLLFPLTYKSYLSSAKMRVLKPQVDEMNSKIPKERTMERQQAAMALYKRAGVNPMGGCIPMLLQFPILIALFRFFPASIELRQQSFLWADDLSTYDSIAQLPFSIPFYGDHISLFTLLMCGSIVLVTLIQSDQMSSASSMPGMKIMMWMMPVMMLFWFNNYACGLSYYYFLANIITYGQTKLIRQFVDDKKILAKLETNKAKPVKKSKFQQKLEEAAKKRGYKLPK